MGVDKKGEFYFWPEFTHRFSRLCIDTAIMPSIKLQSSDGETFPVDVDIARQSVTIRTMLEDLGMEEEEDEVVPLPNVNAAILKKVIQWSTYHKDDPPPPEDDENKEKRTDDISSWDSDFSRLTKERFSSLSSPPTTWISRVFWMSPARRLPT